MKIKNLTNGLFAALLIASPMAGAATDYPAADFQPQIVYQDAEYIKKGGQSAGASQAKTSKADPKYPAANFQPEVIYQDTKYKPGKSTSRTATSAAAGSDATDSSGADIEEDSSSTAFLFGLVVIALAGFFFMKKQPQLVKAVRKTYSTSNAESGLTGVSRYLKKIDVSAVTGVARYLQDREKVPVTGVSKYMAKRVVSAKQAAAEKATGVEKYLRNKG